MLFKYFIEHNGENWQSVFPAAESAKSQVHADADDALLYMVQECGIPADKIQVVPTHYIKRDGTFQRVTGD